MEDTHPNVDDHTSLPDTPVDAERSAAALEVDKAADTGRESPTPDGGPDAAPDASFMASHLIGFIERVSKGAERSITHIRWLFIGAAVVAAVTLYYFIGVRDWHWSIAGVPAVLLALPTVVLLVGMRMLQVVAGLPAKVIGMGHALAEISKEHWPMIRKMEASDLKGLTKWRSYMLLAKILWKARTLQEDGVGLYGSLGMVAAVCNPVFWAVMLGAIALLLVECAVMVLACLGFLIFG